MGWEQVVSHCAPGRRPAWWDSEPGVSASRKRMIINKPLADVLQVKRGDSLMIFLDKQNNAVAMRTPKPQEMVGAYLICKGSKDRDFHCSVGNKLQQTFSWFRIGMCFKCTLEENGDSALMVFRNKL